MSTSQLIKCPFIYGYSFIQCYRDTLLPIWNWITNPPCTMYYSVIFHVSRVVKVLPISVITSDFIMISPAGKNIFEPAKTTTLHVSSTNLVFFYLQGPDILTGFYRFLHSLCTFLPVDTVVMCETVFTWYKPNPVPYGICPKKC